MVEDTLAMAALYQAYLKDEAYELRHVDTGAKAIEFIKAQQPDIILLDLHLPDMSGMEILTHVQEHYSACSVVVMTAHGSVDVAVEAMRLGATDYLAKPISAERLKVTLKNISKLHQLDLLVENYHKEFKRKQFQGFIGSSMAMQSVYRVIESAAPSKASVFITGESGTGKELCAQAIHELSSRKAQPLITLNCAAIPSELMESEIFGHVKGAFTGAFSNRKGAAELADGGTLFLDELCEMDLSLQSKLLRFIQTGYFQRVGESRLRKVDVRFISATNREPLKEVEQGRFREDLYYRLHVLPVHLPPLRERSEDVIEISEYFLEALSREEQKNFQGFSAQAKAKLLQYQWPGNIRQLQNTLHQLVVIYDSTIVEAEMLALDISVNNQRQNEQNLSKLEAIKPEIECKSEVVPLLLVEKRAIEHAIEYCEGNIVKAAALLEVNPSTVYRKLQSWKQKGLIE